MEQQFTAGDGDWVYLPAPPDTESYTDLGEFTVHGEHFRVRRRDRDGSMHYDWESGPNEGYGFTVSGYGQEPSHEHHLAQIRGFLSEIDPETGYL